MFIRSILFAVFILNVFAISASNFIWYDGQQAISYNVPRNTSPVVNIALNMFAEDMKLVTGLHPKQVSSKHAAIRIIQLDKADNKTQKDLQVAGIPVNDLIQKQDAFYIAVTDDSPKQQLLIVGSNGRGTAYGILELSRMAGVSPWVWWGDVTPRKQTQLTVASDFKSMQSPSVKYRGIFLNDEDWSLQPWSWKTFEPGNPTGRIGARTYKEIFKLLLRLRANAIWPGMHGITTPFILFRVPKKPQTVAE